MKKWFSPGKKLMTRGLFHFQPYLFCQNISRIQFLPEVVACGGCGVPVGGGRESNCISIGWILECLRITSYVKKNCRVRRGITFLL